MVHGPATEWKEDKSEGYKSKLGLIMFAIYVVLYLAFILIAVISPKSLGVDIGSLNLAIVYGFGLIVFAIIQAVIYNVLCSRHEKMHTESGHEGGKAQ
jgi:uncharacterized membrane protein (DUF485 family)